MQALLINAQGDHFCIRMLIESIQVAEGDFSRVTLDLLGQDGDVVVYRRDIVPTDLKGQVALANEYEILFHSKVRESQRLRRWSLVGEYVPGEDVPDDPDLPGSFQGSRVAFTGLPMRDTWDLPGCPKASREALGRRVVEAGGTLHDQIYPNTTLLVRGPGLKPTYRIAQAKEFGVPVIRVAELLEMIA